MRGVYSLHVPRWYLVLKPLHFSGWTNGWMGSPFLRLRQSSQSLSPGAFRSGGQSGKSSWTNAGFPTCEELWQPRIMAVEPVVETGPWDVARHHPGQVSLVMDGRWCLHIHLLLSSYVPRIRGVGIVEACLEVLGPAKGHVLPWACVPRPLLDNRQTCPKRAAASALLCPLQPDDGTHPGRLSEIMDYLA